MGALSPSDGPFTAAPAAAGYLYQARLALLLCVRHAYGSGAGLEVAVERLDDVSFEVDGVAVELLQAKHHLDRAADLSDASPDLWKTLRAWSGLVAEDPGIPSRTRLVLVTTAVAGADTAVALLRPGTDGVVPGQAAAEAATRLAAVAGSSRNRALASAFGAFLSLSPPMRASLLSAVRLLDGQPRVQDLDTVLEDALRAMAPRGKAGEVRCLLEGWWWPRMLTALTREPVGSIPILEVEARMDEIRESLRRDALTTEFEHADLPDAEGANYDEQPFVRQLRDVGIGGGRVQNAKRDYFRAFSQRSTWARQHAVLDDEVARFEATLREEWEPHFQAMCDEHADAAPDCQALLEAGRTVYGWVETEARFPFRTVVKRFLNVGSFHMLANELRVGWHRDFVSRGRTVP